VLKNGSRNTCPYSTKARCPVDAFSLVSCIYYFQSASPNGARVSDINDCTGASLSRILMIGESWSAAGLVSQVPSF
jgi:hypothetical protein